MSVVPMANGCCPSCNATLTETIEPHDSILTMQNGHAVPESICHDVVPAKSFHERNNRELQEFDLLDACYSFRGRIPRSTYWLASILGTFAFLFIFMVAHTLLGKESIVFQSIAVVLVFAFWWMSFAINIKRLHDLNCTGWVSLVGLLPGFGHVMMLFTGFIRGTRGRNRYGEDPLRQL
jgi:uncharacterized membrane protein YhaH (DUF805 family)